MKTWLLHAIRAYQRWLSPRKGYGCAHRVHRRRASGCSGLGLRAIRRYGAWRGLLVLRQRFKRCAQSAQWLHEQQRRNAGRPWVPQAQRGDCDLGCGDADCGNLPCNICDCSNLAQHDERLRDTLVMCAIALVILVVIGLLLWA